MTSRFRLPDGTYFSVIGNVRLEAGGQTRLALLRHRLFTLHTDHELPILTFNPIASYEPIRMKLRELGLLLETSKLLNLHEDLRIRCLDDLDSVVAPEPLSSGSVDDVKDGYVWRRQHVGLDGAPSHFDYLRADGSLYARTPPPKTDGPAAIFDRTGRAVATWPTKGGLWRWWVSTLMPDKDRVFLLSDSRFVAEELIPLTDDRVFLLHQMHNPHLTGERRWNSKVSPTYRSSMDRLGELDALISLTTRQREDISKNYGSTNNLFVIPNPVESPEAPEPLPVRGQFSVAMIARLTRQKRIDRAIAAFAEVVAAIPQATLDIYGDGPLREDLQAQIDNAGLGDSIILRGYDPNARQNLWTASVFWLTSQFEGYPLSTLEAMSHGCPVLSFDVKYGPREQIDNCIDGMLVPPADTAALAARTIAILNDVPRLTTMSASARAKAAHHDHQNFLTEWAKTLEQVVVLKPTRTRVDLAEWSISRTSDEPIEFSGTLRLGTSATDMLADVMLSAFAYSPGNEDIADVPLEVHRSGNELTFSGTVESPAAVKGSLRARVGYVWHNCAGTIEILPDGSRGTAAFRSFRTRVGATLRRAGLRR